MQGSEKHAVAQRRLTAALTAGLLVATVSVIAGVVSLVLAAALWASWDLGVCGSVPALPRLGYLGAWRVVAPWATGATVLALLASWVRGWDSRAGGEP